jgi:uncharacterized protein YabE (DUF348 family)
MPGSMKPIWFGILSAALVLAGGWLIVLGMEKTVTLVVDGQQRHLVTSAFTVGGLLKAENISVGEQDNLLPEVDQWIQNGSVILLERSSQIHIQTDDSSKTLLSTERFPANLLAEASMRLYPGDRLLVDGQPVLPDQKLALGLTHSLQVRRTVPLNLVDLGGQARTIYSAAATLGQALWEAGITLYNGDRINPGLETPLNGPLQATVMRSKEVVIKTKSGQVKMRMAVATVGEALSAAGLAPQGYDYSQPSLGSPLPVDGQIRLVRVEENIQLEQKLQPFETFYQPMTNLDVDTQQILQAGESGVIAQRIYVRSEDGNEVSRKVDTQWMVREAKPRIIGYGTKVAKRTLDTPEGQITYWRSLTMYATSYSPCRLGKPNYCHETTATGAILQKGLVAVTRANFAIYGNTQLYIPGYGFATVADIGAGIPGKEWIDLGYSDKDWVQWGQNVTVYFLWPPPNNFPHP